MKRIHPAHIGLVVVVLICIALGFCVAKVGAQENPSWNLIKEELSGREPDKVSVENLSAAMSMAMLNHPEQAIPLFQTAIIIACNSKPYPKRSAVFVLYTACLTLEAQSETFIEMARKLCPNSGAANKVVLPKSEIEEDLSTPLNFAGISPPSGPWEPVTPVQNR